MRLGALAALLAGAGGFALEGLRLGWSDEAGMARVERHVTAQVASMTASLDEAALRLSRTPGLVEAMKGNGDSARQLFDLVADVRRQGVPEDLALTVYGATGTALAWGGRPSELPLPRLVGPAAFFVAPGPLGLRLVHIRPIFDRPEGEAAPVRWFGSIAAERVLSPAGGMRGVTADEFLLRTPVAPVAVRTRYEGAGEQLPAHAFLLRDPDGHALLEARVAASDLRTARARWRLGVAAVVLGLSGLTMLLLAGPLLDRRLRLREPRVYLGATAAVAGLIVLARLLFWVALPLGWPEDGLTGPSAGDRDLLLVLLRSPADFLLTSLALIGLVAVAGPVVARARVARRGARFPPSAGPYRFAAQHLAAGAGLLVLLLAATLATERVLAGATTDVIRFSLHPWEAGRVAQLAGLVLLHAAALWAGVLLLLVSRVAWRIPRRAPRERLMAAALWLGPVALAALAAATRGWPLPAGALLLMGAAAVAAAAGAWRAAGWYRRASQGARLVTLFLALIVPALLMYPGMLFFAERIRGQLVETQYAVQAASHPQELQTRLSEALAQIDGIPSLGELVAALDPAPGPPPTEAAFLVWSQTSLAQFRLTSAVELYGPDGGLVSRFALNFPEYTTTVQTWHGASCDWDVFGEAAPFGSQERRMLHAERALCPDGDPAAANGAIVVHVMLDYRTLPFISSQSPYFEFFRAAQARPEGLPPQDVELAIYGWGLHPIYVSGTGAWPLDDELFARIYASREPFWARLPRRGAEYDVYISNDRAGIYAIGYPRLDAFAHLIHLAELATLAGLIYLLLLAGAAAFGRLARARGRFGRALLREIRASFYRKLFLAFVAAAVVPVLTLAFVIRTYFAAQLRADVEGEAARTAEVARRVIEEQAAALQLSPEEPVAPLSDDVMVWISQVIDQDVNIFVGPTLVATSERDLFASGLLPTRTPENVYRAIVLQRLPSFVGEDAIGGVRYMLAAAPVRAGGRDAILTVPQALRQQEIERELEELDRGVHLAALVFVLLGAGIGFWMAERIADPVRRLTRATGRIAAGDFDARIAVTSADELRRLVEAFNSMAAELKAQRAQLERTHRLEAWAEMARQVAHEIKNPLTPIQLSAEHLRRVHADRGAPLSPVLEACLDSILEQVRLLRQISAEFSSFASAPTARPEPAALADLVREVVEPYRTGLSDRIDLRVDLAGDLPPVTIDRTLVARALSNVIENALHAMPGRGALSLAAHAEDGAVRLTVTDNGVGMDPQALERIFEPYFSTKAIGTGLGLTIAKRNVELSGGTIEVTSEKGRGTRVTLTFPV